MRIHLMIILVLCNTLGRANSPDVIFKYIIHKGLTQIPDTLDCDTTCRIKDFEIRIVKEQGKINQIGLNLFNDDIKKSVDKNLLCLVEEALLAKVLNIKADLYNRVVINNGSLADFKSLSPQSDFSISTINSKYLTIEWPLNNRYVSVTLPNNYDTSSSGTRSEIENDFIAELKSFKGSRIPFEPIDTLRLEPYGEDKLIYAGDSYQNRFITRNIYLGIENICPVYDIQSPVESIANLFIFPSEISDSIKVDLTILKHEYGEKEYFVIPLSQLLAACEGNGCIAFWGMEKYEEGILEGVLFLYNKYRGYDHVIKVECNPEVVLNKRGHIKARASLFIPTNNVQNLYSPYIKKDENKKIKYDK